MAQATLGAAAQYRLLREKNRAKEQTYQVRTPKTGMMWTMRRPDLLPYFTSGNLPMHLVAQAVESYQESGEDGLAAIPDLTPKEQIKTLVFMRDLVKQSAVSPAITENPQSDDEIAPEEIDWDDFMHLYRWCISGGEQAEMLETFRDESGQPAVARTSAKGNGKARKRAA